MNRLTLLFFITTSKRHEKFSTYKAKTEPLFVINISHIKKPAMRALEFTFVLFFSKQHQL